MSAEARIADLPGVVARLNAHLARFAAQSGTFRRPAPALACVVALQLSLAGCKEANVARAAQPQTAPAVVAAPPLRQKIVDWDDYVGRFEASKSVEIRPRVGGYLQALHFRDGDLVRKGELLFVIDPRPYQAALEEAQAQEASARASLELAQVQLDRARTLVASQAVSRAEFDNRAAAFRTAQAAVRAAQALVRSRALDLDFTQVRSPIDGRVSNRRVDVGNLVAGGSAAEATLLTTVVAVDPIYFTFNGSEALYLKYSRQDAEGTRLSSRGTPNPVEIRLQDEPTYRWRGRMDFVDNALDRGAGTIAARAVVDNPKGFLTPGMFGRMRLLGSGAYEALLIPDGAVLTDQTRKTVLVVDDDGKAIVRVVELGPLVDGLRVVRTGLKAEDRVIINGLQRARAGDKVDAKAGEVVPPAPGTSPTVEAYRLPASAEATSVSASTR